MDNNYEQAPQRRRKRVTKQMLRRRQLCGLAGIALVVLIIFVLCARACSKQDPEAGKTDTAVVTTTAPPVTIPPVIETTVPATTVNPLAEQVKLSTRALYLDIGETDVAIINAYPEGCTESDEKWEIEDSSIASINEWGYVTGVSAGETYAILSFKNNPDIRIEIKVTVADGGAPAAPTVPPVAGDPSTVSNTTVSGWYPEAANA